MLTWFYEFVCSCRCSCECSAGAAQARMTTNFLFNLFSVQGFQKVKVKHRRTFAVTQIFAVVSALKCCYDQIVGYLFPFLGYIGS